LSARANQLLGWLGLQYFTACTTLSYEMGCALGLQYFTATPRFSPIPKAAQLQPIFIIAAKSIGKGPKYHNNYLHISSKIANKPIDHRDCFFLLTKRSSTVDRVWAENTDKKKSCPVYSLEYLRIIQTEADQQRGRSTIGMPAANG
jgi:hypothetical protein